jgi:hypothetical protein
MEGGRGSCQSVMSTFVWFDSELNFLGGRFFFNLFKKKFQGKILIFFKDAANNSRLFFI